MDTDPASPRPRRSEHDFRGVRASHTSWACARRALPLICAALLLTAGIAGCGGSSGATKSSTAKSSSIQSGCQQVAAVLSDGPDPGADPVGYAEAQILQLRMLHSSQYSLRQKIDTLASAYQAYSSTDGTNVADKNAANAAIRAMDKACPGSGATL
jgi:hypothetical protein